MCGIVGYTGKRQAQPVLLGALARLEYRGYDSCGIAVAGESLSVYKDAVRIKELGMVCPLIHGNTGIGHTRWATHGPPSRLNAHPHLDCTGRFAVVHNGVITNYEMLKRELIAEGHHFASETDTEVIAHLIEKYYSGDIEEAVAAAIDKLEGSYAVAVLMAGCDRVVAARQDSPLIIGLGDGENIIASDVPALLEYTNTVLYLENGDFATVRADGVQIRNGGRAVERAEQKVAWRQADVEKGGYAHYMLKEIYEQPRVIRDTLEEFANSDSISLAGEGKESIAIVACGTSYHAALIGKNVIESLCNIPVKAGIASEFRPDGTERRAAVFAITQSGETADVIAAMKRLKESGVGATVITNVRGSTASRLAERALYTRAGPEVSVAATKTFIAQLVTLFTLAISQPCVGKSYRETLLAELKQLPRRVEQVLDGENEIRELAGFLAGFESAFFIGRGISYPVALEGALKLKEISYIHAEGCPAGELKHGPFALLTDKTPVIAVLADDNTYTPMLTSLKEVKARNAPVIAVAPESEGLSVAAGLADYIITVPGSRGIFSPVTSTVALQLLAYYTARERGCPIDFPRNLAKSVTVE